MKQPTSKDIYTLLHASCMREEDIFDALNNAFNSNLLVLLRDPSPQAIYTSYHLFKTLKSQEIDYKSAILDNLRERNKVYAPSLDLLFETFMNANQLIHKTNYAGASPYIYQFHSKEVHHIYISIESPEKVELIDKDPYTSMVLDTLGRGRLTYSSFGNYEAFAMKNLFSVETFVNYGTTKT